MLPAVATPPFSGLGRVSNICHALDFSLMTWKKKKKSSLKPTRDKPDSSFYPGVRQPPPSAFPTHLKFPEGTQKGQRGFSFANAPPASFTQAHLQPSLVVGLRFHHQQGGRNPTCRLHSLLECRGGWGAAAGCEWLFRKAHWRKKRGKLGASFH